MESILEHFALRLDEGDERPVIWRASESGFQPITWRELYRHTCQLASALRRHGIAPGQPVVHVSENRWEWVVTDLAIRAAGAVHVPAHAPLSGAQIAWQLQDTGSRLLIASTQLQLDKLSGQQLPRDMQTLSYDEIDGASTHPLHPQLWRQFQQTGDPDHGEDILQKTIASQSADAAATILYTSGTTGEPKGVMLSDRNLCSNAVAACEVFAQKSDDRRLGFLPLSHIFARTCDLYVTIVGGSQLAIASSRESVIPDCQAMRATHMNGVPYFFQKVQQSLCDAGQAENPAALKATFGGAMKFLCSGGAPLPVETFDFYEKRDLPILQGYGLSETSPIISASSASAFRRGASGVAIPGVEVRCADDGEIMTRGPHVMLGYYKNDQATADIIRDGWLYTGDLGNIDDDGYVFITGRKKEIIVTSSGKNISPLLIEQRLQMLPIVEQALVVGDNRPYLSAILVLDVPACESMANPVTVETTEAAPNGSDFESWMNSAAAKSKILEIIGEHLADLSHHEQVRQIVLRSEPFTVENGELTPKLSIRRNAIASRHQAELELLYR